MAILGISAHFHDSAAALVENDGSIRAAVQEERFSRIKHDSSFPKRAIQYVLSETTELIDAVVFYEKPVLKFERQIDTLYEHAPKGARGFITGTRSGLIGTINSKNQIRRELRSCGIRDTIPLLFSEHHFSHAASAFYPSPFTEAAILTIDGVGEYATTTIGHGKDNALYRSGEIRFPHSLGLFYTTCATYCGFPANDGEGSFMGLAGYGDAKRANAIEQLMKKQLMTLHDDGSFKLNPQYFSYSHDDTMFNERRWRTLFSLASCNSDVSPMVYADFARAAQRVLEHAVLSLAKETKKRTVSKNVVLAGGVALNCLANRAIEKSGLFENIWVQPAAGDAGGALGAALIGHYVWKCSHRRVAADDGMRNSLLGPSATSMDVSLSCPETIQKQAFTDKHLLYKKVARLLAQGNIVGWCRGKIEWGPRALGTRSILADARNTTLRDRINQNIKKRENFRPLAPVVLAEDVYTYFEDPIHSPYMLMTAAVRKGAGIPAVTHIDNTARLQTVEALHGDLYALLQAFKGLTGFGVLVNTSLNRSGEPIALTSDDAMRVFMSTDMDSIVIGDTLFSK